MSKKIVHSKTARGFTLLEILLTVAILAILSAVTLSAINPIRQMAQARDSQRKNDVMEIHKSVQQYLIDKKVYPTEAKDGFQVYGICNTVDASSSQGCGDLLNIAKVIPVYLSGIPTDPSNTKGDINTAYRIALNPTTGVYVEAPKTEIGQGISKTIVYIGKPPRGYVIPTIEVAQGTTTETTFLSFFTEGPLVWPEWADQLVIAFVGIIVGYMIGSQKKIGKK